MVPNQGGKQMTVHELLESYFGLDSKFQAIVIVQNDGGKQKTLYFSPYGYHEMCMRPEIRSAAVRKWGLAVRPNRIWGSVEKESERRADL